MLIIIGYTDHFIHRRISLSCNETEGKKPKDSAELPNFKPVRQQADQHAQEQWQSSSIYSQRTLKLCILA